MCRDEQRPVHPPPAAAAAATVCTLRNQNPQDQPPKQTFRRILFASVQRAYFVGTADQLYVKSGISRQSSSQATSGELQIPTVLLQSHGRGGNQLCAAMVAAFDCWRATKWGKTPYPSLTRQPPWPCAACNSFYPSQTKESIIGCYKVASEGRH
jgi:hypothetical protein